MKNKLNGSFENLKGETRKSRIKKKTRQKIISAKPKVNKPYVST